METINILFLKTIGEFGPTNKRAESLRSETGMLAKHLESLVQEERDLGGDPARYRAKEREDSRRTVAGLREELGAAEAKPPRLFGKSDYLARLENLRNRIDMSQQSIDRMTAEAPERVRALPGLISSTERELAEKRVALNEHEAKITRLQEGMAMLKDDAYANGIRPAVMELMMAGKTDDRLAHIECSQALEAGLKFLEEEVRDAEASKKSELVYLYVQQVLFEEWFRPNIASPLKRIVELAKELQAVRSKDNLLELAIAFGGLVEVGTTILSSRRNGFDNDVLLMIFKNQLEEIEERLLDVMRSADEEGWKLMAKEHMQRVDRLRRGD